MAFPANAVRICIDERTDALLKGRVYGTMLHEPLFFNDSYDLFLKIDKAFDSQGYPQSFQIKRSFQGEETAAAFNLHPERKTEEASFEKVLGEISTYIVQVVTRKNASWQGRVTNADGKFVGQFTNELELIDLLNI